MGRGRPDPWRSGEHGLAGQGAGGSGYMMEQADSGFRTWQVHAAPQYCRKVW